MSCSRHCDAVYKTGDTEKGLSTGNWKYPAKAGWYQTEMPEMILCDKVNGIKEIAHLCSPEPYPDVPAAWITAATSKSSAGSGSFHLSVEHKPNYYSYYIS